MSVGISISADNQAPPDGGADPCRQLFRLNMDLGWKLYACSVEC